jgi:hypothetical protein
MNLSRRTFLSFPAAPAIIRVADIMPIRPEVLTLWGDGIHDDADALEAFFNGGARVKPIGIEAQRQGNHTSLRHGYLFSSRGIDVRGCEKRTIVLENLIVKAHPLNKGFSSTRGSPCGFTHAPASRRVASSHNPLR